MVTVLKNGVRRGAVVWCAAVVVLALGLVGRPQAAQAVPRSQGALPVRFMEWQVGRLDAAIPQAAFTLDVTEGMVFSVSMFMQTGDVQPQVTVLDPAGAVLAVGVPPSTTTDSSIVNAAVAPATGTYSLVVDRVSGTGGDFVLIVQPGYEKLQAWDGFDIYNADLSLAWRPVASLDSMATINNGEMVLHVLSPQVTTYIAPDESPTFSEYYVEADIVIANAPAYYEYGLGVYKHPNAASFYAVLFSSQCDWALLYFDGQAWTTIQEWTSSPVMTAVDERVNVGVWVQRGTFSVYFNHELVGRVIDPLPRASSGTLALLGGSGQAAPANVELHFDNLVITTPLTVGP